MDEKLLTAAQAARLKGVSRAAVYKAIEQGRLPHRRVFGHVALLESDVLAWVAARSTGWPKGTPMSAEAKARISAGQKRRWAKRKEMEGRPASN